MILLMGRWDDGGNLVIESSDEFPDDTPEDVIAGLVDEQDNSDNMAWADTFEVSTHVQALRDAYATYVEPEGGIGSQVIDEVRGFRIDV